MSTTPPPNWCSLGFGTSPMIPSKWAPGLQEGASGLGIANDPPREALQNGLDRLVCVFFVRLRCEQPIRLNEFAPPPPTKYCRSLDSATLGDVFFLKWSSVLKRCLDAGIPRHQTHTCPKPGVDAERAWHLGGFFRAKEGGVFSALFHAELHKYTPLKEN